MYFWKTTQLAADIKNNKVSEKSKMYYYLLLTSLSNIMAYEFLMELSYDMTAALSELLLTFLVIIIGTLVTFNTNKGEGGVDYIARVVMLGLPISIKIIALMLTLSIFLSEIVFYYWAYDLLTDTFISIGVVLASVLMFYRLNVHLKFINQA
jgi:hypothetical protein